MQSVRSEFTLFPTQSKSAGKRAIHNFLISSKGFFSLLIRNLSAHQYNGGGNNDGDYDYTVTTKHNLKISNDGGDNDDCN